MKAQFFIALCVIGLALAKPPRLHKRGFVPSPRDPNYLSGPLYSNPFRRPARNIAAFNPFISPYSSYSTLSALPTVATTLTNPSVVATDTEDATVQITADELSAAGVQLPATLPAGLANIDLAGLLRNKLPGALPLNPNLNPSLLGLLQAGLPNGLLASQLALPNLALAGNGLLGLQQSDLQAALNLTLPLADGQVPLGLTGLPSALGLQLAGALQAPQLALQNPTLANSDILGLLRPDLLAALNATLPLSEGQLPLGLAGLQNPLGLQFAGALQAPQLALQTPTLANSDILGLLRPDLLAALNATLPLSEGQLPLGLAGLANPLALQLASSVQPPQLALPATALNGDPRLLGRPQIFLIATVAGRLPLPHVHVTNTYAVPVRVPQPYNVIRNVPVGVRQNVPYPVDKPYPVGVRRPYPVAVDRPYQVSVDRPYGVPVPHPVAVPVERPVGVPVPHPVPVEVRRPFAVPVHVPVPVQVPVPQAVEVAQPVAVDVPTPQEIAVEAPVQRQQVAVEISQPYAVPYERIVPQVRTPVVIPYAIERQVVQEVRHQVINHGTPQEVRQELTVPRAVVQVSTARPALQEVRTQITNHGTPRPFSLAQLVTPQPTVLQEVRHEVTHHGTPRTVLQQINHPVTHLVTPQPILQEVRHEVTHHGTPRTVLQEVRHEVTHHGTPRKVLQEVRHEVTHHGTPRKVLQHINHPVTHLVTPQPILQEVRHEVTHHETPRTVLQEIHHPATHIVTPQPILQEVRHEISHHGTPRTVLQEINHPETHIVTPQPILQEVRHHVTHHVTQRPIVVADGDQNGGDEEMEAEEYDEDNETEDEEKRRIRRN